MNRLTIILLTLIVCGCSKPESADPIFPIHEQALAIAAAQCQSPQTMGWLRDIIQRSEEDIKYKGSIYLIGLKSRTVFLHQPWISSCFGCTSYDCKGDLLTLTESEKTEVISGAREENLIYTSFQ